MKLIMTKGLPASGKSTWAKEQVTKSNGKVKRVNKDDLRAMIDAGIWSKNNEKEILAVRDLIVEYHLLRGNDVIVDDTNLTPNHETRLREVAASIEAAEFEIKSFMGVSLATCLARNAKREHPVPEKAIRSMAAMIKKEKKLKPYIPPVHNDDLPDCIILDIDGTIAHMNGRSPYDYTKVHTDVVDTTVLDIVNKYAFTSDDFMHETYIVIVSGRDNTCQAETEQWLKSNHIPYAEIHMRDPNLLDEKGNKLDDTIIKKDIYEKFIKNRYNVKFVLDDRDRVVKMWRDQGLKCLQVAEGDF